MLEKVDLNSIIQHLLEEGLIDHSDILINNKNGTTDGLVYIISRHNEAKYVLKIDHPHQITVTEQFLHTYRHTILLPKLLYTDPAKAFIVYSYIPGTTHYHRGLKINWMTILVKELFNYYEKYDHNGMWGRLDSPIQSWQEWNERGFEDTRNHLETHLPMEDHHNVKLLVENLAKSDGHQASYLLHGDTGVHNFVFHGLTLVGVIDPSPMIGPVLYDFTYAFCSSPDDLNLETLLAAFALLHHEPMEKSKLIDEVILQLYCRIGICLHYHPHDLQGYLKAWEYWKVYLGGAIK